MIRALIDHIGNPSFGTFSLLLMFVFFVILFWWTYLVVPRAVHDQHALIPFNDEEKKVACSKREGESHE